MDTNLTAELVEEGFVYEVISKIQTMRKDADYEVMDHIKVTVSGNEKIASVVKKNEAVIAGKVLAEEMLTDGSMEDADGWNRKEWNVNGEKATISIRKI